MEKDMGDLQRFWMPSDATIQPEPNDNGQWLRRVDVDNRRREVNAEVALLNAKIIKAEMEADIWQEKYVELSGGLACLVAKCDVFDKEQG